jgi:hypothetical protein
LSLEKTVSTRRSSRIKQALLKHALNAELRWVTHRPFYFRDWELIGDTTTWSTFDQISGKDKAITEVTVNGRTFWVEASRRKDFDAGWLLIMVFCAICVVLIWVTLIMFVMEPTKTELVFHTVDPRKHGRDPNTMTYVSSRKSFKRALEMRQPQVLTDI